MVIFILLLIFLSSSVHSLSTVSISRAGNQTLVCALTHPSESSLSNYLNCTSFPRGRIQIPVNPSFSSFTGIVGGNGFLCGLSLSSSSNSSVLVCWRFSTDGADMEYKRIYRGAELQDLDSGNSHICAVTSAGGLECWNWRREFSSTAIASSLAVGEEFVCGVSKSGQVQCSGSYTDVVDHFPAGNFSVVSAGSGHACAVSTAGRLNCWGNMAGKEPPGEFTSLACADESSCALRPNGTVACWGNNQTDFRDLPESFKNTSFISLQGKGNVFCGVTTADYSVYCWGRDGGLIGSSNDAVFQNVFPGPCRRSCPCSFLPDYGSYCSPGLMICLSCEGEETPPATPSSPPAQTITTKDGGKWNKAMVAFLVVGCIGSLSLIIVACFLFFKRCKCQRSVSRVHDSGPMDDPPTNPAALEKKLSKVISMGSCLEEYSLETLLLATDGFSDEHKIGNGSFGSVYIGTLPGGSIIAIKRAETSSSTSQNCIAATTKHNQQQQDDQDSAFVNELEFMSRLNHKNLVRLLGFCEDSTERILVYEYMKNGSLSDHLYKLEMESSPILSSWPARIKLALDAARGIQYLHQFAVPPIIHRDIKSSNILLDETWTAKISDFGLSLFGPPDEESHLSLKVAGTVGYIDPEYYRLQRLTTKSDVYSFGVVLLELLSGYKAIHTNENGDPRNVVDIVVPYIVKDEIHRVLEPRVHPPTPVEIEAVAYVGYLAADCVKLEGANRPTMTEIVNSLERALTACLAPPALFRSNSTSSDE